MTSPPAGTIHDQFMMDHEELDELLEALASAFRSDDWELASETYADFEARLTTHLRVEEELLFPELAKTQPGETEDLRHEHQAIRSRVFELGIGIDVHQTTLPAIEELGRMLRNHAAREDHMLYRWADRHFGEPASTIFFHGRSPEAPVH